VSIRHAPRPSQVRHGQGGHDPAHVGQPGFGGQSFLRSSLDKLREARKLIDASGRPIRLEIDGGVKVDNIREIAEAGADTFVAGSAIFNAARKEDPQHYNSVLKALRAELAKAK